MKKIFFLLFLLPSILLAQTANDLFTTANNLYKEGKYKEAIKVYQKIEKKDQVSSDVYYNLGNCYYKLNEVAATIYNYEKALSINPLHKDATNNLVFAKRLTLDRIEELPKSILQKFNENYLQKLTYNQWAIVVVVLSFLASILFLLFYFSEIPTKKRFYFISSILSFIMLFSSLLITINQYNLSTSKRHAIVFSKKIDVKNAPTLNGNDVFTIHEGTKIMVLDEVDNWKKVKLADGKIGWLIADEIKEL
ncbi:SH3 domain-containing protein [Lutibacter sp. Hel_I_33_5]|uniref:tetratricopeptide repeat protein n=1 Tax=Lutibacter sp. Hel_I_33_5 TaxID=1566289 RepID=UPI0011A858D3|nr:tetratricopeptide repeat protein [Lutibacter sp. Hel_I_33_5]TVZ56499.1 SH3 domain-containing protein [Lutibacter sp. Hel_I_33_5]